MPIELSILFHGENIGCGNRSATEWLSETTSLLVLSARWENGKIPVQSQCGTDTPAKR
jgi:hypothetical protein